MERIKSEHLLLNRHFKDINPLFCGEEDCFPGKSVGPFIRKHTLIHYVVKGSGVVIKDNETYEVGAGEAFLIYPGEMVTYKASKEDPWFYQWVAFVGDFQEDFAKLPTVVSLPEDMMTRIIQSAEMDIPEYRITKLLWEMYIYIFEGGKVSGNYVRRVKEYIKVQYTTPITVEGIAEALNINRRHLSRLFKEKTGYTIQEYLIAVRMDEAKILLEMGNSVEQTARLCGYQDPFNFSKMFKKRFGVSPKKWQKDNKK